MPEFWHSQITPGSRAAAILNDLVSVGAFYCCPRNEDGMFAGPLVGYAGAYAPNLHYVGDTYIDIGGLESELPDTIRKYAAEFLRTHRTSTDRFDTLIGVPSGGIMFSAFLALVLRKRWVLAQKKVIGDTVEGERSKTVFVFDRHDIVPGRTYCWVEDISNNLSASNAITEAVSGRGGTITAGACIWNRSARPQVDGIPILSLAHVPMPQWQQHDPVVRDHVADGNVIWKARSRRWELQRIMRQNPPSFLRP